MSTGGSSSSPSRDATAAERPSSNGGGGENSEGEKRAPKSPTSEEAVENTNSDAQDETTATTATAASTVVPRPRSSRTASTSNNRNSNSLRQFTQRFRSFSNDLLRSIESAHDMVDLGNSNFSTATQLAAAQHFLAPFYLGNPATTASTGSQPNVPAPLQLSTPTSGDDPTGQVTTPTTATPLEMNFNDLVLDDLPEEDAEDDEDDHVFDKKSEEKNRNEELVAESNQKVQIDGKNLNLEVVGSKETIATSGPKSPTTTTASPSNTSIRPVPPVVNQTRAGSTVPIDEMNATNDPSRRVIYRNPIEHHQAHSHPHPSSKTSASAILAATAASMMPSPIALQSIKAPTGKDQVDFRIKKRHILRNGIKIAIPDDIRISILEVFIYLWGVITFFADLISDIILSIEYYKSSRTWLGSMTLTFVIVPNVTLSLFSLSWYIDKYYAEKRIKQQIEEDGEIKENGVGGGDEVGGGKKKPISSTCDSITFWITTIFFVVFQLDLVWKYIQGFVYTLKGWAWGSLFKNLKWEKYYIKKQIKCDTDIGMLRLIDVFLDSGPQVLLQLYVITTQNLNEIGSANLVYLTFKDFQTTSVELKQLISILSSLFSMSYAVAGYHRCLRNQQFIFCLKNNQPLPRPMSWPSTIMQFLWYLCLIAPRVLSMAIFASTFRSWFFMIIFTHWLIMYFWILSLKTNFCITSEEVYNAREEIFEKFYNFVCSFIYIFVYFNLKAGPTRLRYLIYYVIFYAENILFCSCYFMFSKETNFDFKLTMLLIVVLGFWFAITFQIIYYLYWHPSHNIRVCVRTKNNTFEFIYSERLKPRPNNWSSEAEQPEIIMDSVVVKHQSSTSTSTSALKRASSLLATAANGHHHHHHNSHHLIHNHNGGSSHVNKAAVLDTSGYHSPPPVPPSTANHTLNESSATIELKLGSNTPPPRPVHLLLNSSVFPAALASSSSSLSSFSSYEDAESLSTYYDHIPLATQKLHPPLVSLTDLIGESDDDEEEEDVFDQEFYDNIESQCLKETHL